MSDKDLILRFVRAGEIALSQGFTTCQIIAAFEVAKAVTIQTQIEFKRSTIQPARGPLPPENGGQS